MPGTPRTATGAENVACTAMASPNAYRRFGAVDTIRMSSVVRGADALKTWDSP